MQHFKRFTDRLECNQKRAMSDDVFMGKKMTQQFYNKLFFFEIKQKSKLCSVCLCVCVCVCMHTGVCIFQHDDIMEKSNSNCQLLNI